jgi:hypothetical protein
VRGGAMMTTRAWLLLGLVVFLGFGTWLIIGLN